MNDPWDQEERWWSKEEYKEYNENELRLSQYEQEKGANMRKTVKQIIISW